MPLKFCQSNSRVKFWTLIFFLVLIVIERNGLFLLKILILNDSMLIV